MCFFLLFRACHLNGGFVLYVEFAKKNLRLFFVCLVSGLTHKGYVSHRLNEGRQSAVQTLEQCLTKGLFMQHNIFTAFISLE